MSLARPPRFRLTEQAAGRLTLAADHGPAMVHIFVLEDDLLRVMVLANGGPDQPRSWAIAPGLEDLPAEGRDRFDLAGFTLPAFAVEAVEDDILTVETAAVRLRIDLAGLRLAWSVRCGEAWIEAARDRPTQAYNLGWWDEKVYHYLRREPGERYYGLGERSGDLDRAGRRLRLSNLDAMGYDARTGDPLYKHMPVYITARPEQGLAFGLLYDTAADCTFDFGQERDNYHGLYRAFVADHGDLDYYFIAGEDLPAVVRRLTWLTGRPALMPRWSLGYSGSTMAYTDAPDAQARMDEFLAGCAAHDVLCDSFHLSSGYTSIGATRNVFHWNRDKFPDPAGFARRYAEHGVRIVANIKPCLMEGNPLFAQAKGQGVLLSEADGQPHWTQFWDAPGVYVDFTHPKAAAWWGGQVTRALLEVGIDATWNDNNEFEVISPRALCHGFGDPRPARELKPVLTTLMLRASREAQIKHAPDVRPYLVTRAGGLGLQRYAQTWSGDNATAWETVRYNQRMGLGLSLSGVSNFGHDIGGFAGPAPDAELLVRWVQAGLFLPRFSIHSWNDDGTANEPWMHPQAAETISRLIKLRAKFAPYLYHLLWRCHAAYEPVLRPLFHDFPGDPLAWAESDDFLVGQDLLAAPVMEPGQAERTARLPAGADWWDVWTGEVFAGGETVVRPAPWDHPVLFARAGAIIPVNLAEQHFAQPADERGLLVFPPLGEGVVETFLFDDDGVSWPDRDAPSGWRVRMTAEPAQVSVVITGEGERAGEAAPTVIWPAGERRIKG